MFSKFAALLLACDAAIAAPNFARVVNCLSAANVPQQVPGSSSFLEDIIPYNLRLNYTPIALAIPQYVDFVRCFPAGKCR